MKNHKVLPKVQNLIWTRIKISKISRSLLIPCQWFCSPKISGNQSVGASSLLVLQLAQLLQKSLPQLRLTLARILSALIIKKTISNLIQITRKLSIKIIAVLTSARQSTPTSAEFAGSLLLKPFSPIRPSALTILKELSTFSKTF